MKSKASMKSRGKSRLIKPDIVRTTSGTTSTKGRRKPQNTKSSPRTISENQIMRNASRYVSIWRNIITCLSVSLALLELSKSSIGLSDSSQLSYDKCSKLLADIARTSSCKLSEMQEALSITRTCLDDYSIGLTGRSSNQSLVVLKIQGLSRSTLTNSSM